jgi:helicase MOV-10
MCISSVVLRHYLTFMSPSVVKLLNNYRSHPAILKFPNEQFYNGELMAAASAEKIGKYLGSPILPCSKFPIVFHAISGKDEREASSPSFFNKHEAIQVKLYVRMLQTAKKYQTSELKDFSCCHGN